MPKAEQSDLGGGMRNISEGNRTRLDFFYVDFAVSSVWIFVRPVISERIFIVRMQL
jgi:hypothetical protein